MKIGIVSTYNVECGISTYTEHLTQYYPDDTIIFANKFGSLSDTHNIERFKIIRCWERTGDFRELTREILNNNIDLVHIQHEYGLFQNNQSFLGMLKELKRNNVKIVITYHTVFLDGHHEMDKKLIVLMPHLDHVIVHHQIAKEILDNDKCIVIPHGSVEARAKPREESRKQLCIPQDKFVCTYLGFISPNKGQIETAMVILNLRHEFPNIYLVIAGMPVVHGTNYGNLEYCLNLFRSVKRMEGFNYIKITPSYIKESDFDYYAGATDIFIENHGPTQCSISGISHLIMSYGKPSVSSCARILDDLNEERSVKYDIGDIKGMENAIRKLIQEPQLRQQIAKKAHEYAHDTNWQIIANRHLQLYDI